MLAWEQISNKEPVWAGAVMYTSLDCWIVNYASTERLRQYYT